MNFLAHFYLAYGNSNYLVGQFIADAVKGRVFDQYSTEIQDGIRMHRMVDSLTDTNEALSRLRSEIRPYTGLLSPVVLDLLMDHQLAKHWSEFHGLTLHDFAQHTYSELRRYTALMPERMSTTLHYMEQYNWLEGYATEEGLTKSIIGLSKRVTRGEQMLSILPIIKSLDIQCQQVLKTLLPLLANSVKQEITTIEPSYLSIKHYFL